MHRDDLIGTQMMTRHAELERFPQRAGGDHWKTNLEHGLESAASIEDRSIPLFSRVGVGPNPTSTFGLRPYLEDMRQLGDQDVAVVGIPFDGGTTNRPGTRFGPKSMRAVSSYDGGYNADLGISLWHSLDIVDVGDVTVIPASIEKTFDQVSKAVDYLYEKNTFPVILGGDHSIAYATIRALAARTDGNVGIIHCDRHMDLTDTDLDGRLHSTPFYHLTKLPNIPASNLVQIGVGGWAGSWDGVARARDRGATAITMSDVDRFGIEKVAELALEIAWKGAKAVYLSFDIDCVDPAYAPGTGTPEPGGFTSREILRLLGIVAREGFSGMELVEVSPPYDVAEITALLGTRVIYTVLGTLIEAGKLGVRPGTGEELPPAEISSVPADLSVAE